MDKYMYWLDNVPRLGWEAKCRLLEAFQTPENVYLASEKYLKYVLEEKKVKAVLSAQKSWDVEDCFDTLTRRGIQMITITEEGFPQKLKNIPDPTFALYYLGQLPREDFPSVAVIGARECSEYGSYIAGELGKYLGQNHIQVISGMARGIDGISQSAALEAGGCSYGIMGCGVDICYPASNRALYDRLCREGGILSTYPPGTEPRSQLFPPRNRIVSGLADVLVVVEARQKSGTSITVEMALEQGRDIYAVPGRITDRLSDGCNQLLRDGAHVFLSPRDFVEELKQLLPVKMENLLKKNKIGIQESLPDQINENQGKSTKPHVLSEKILAVLDYYPQHVDTLVDKLKNLYDQELSVTELNIALMELSLKDLVKQQLPGWFTKGDS